MLNLYESDSPITIQAIKSMQELLLVKGTGLQIQV